MILDAITSSPLNVFFTIFIGLGLAYFYYRKPSSSSSTSTSTAGASHSAHRLNSGLNSRTSLRGGSGNIISEELQRTIAQIERQERNMIRQEQDEAYQQSLKADREKQLKREQELRDKEAEEKAKIKKLEELEQLQIKLTQLKSIITDKLPPEPTSGNNDIVKLVFKLPDGSRVKRNFFTSDKVKYLYWYVFSIDSAPLQFKLTTNFPKRDLPGRPPIPEDFDTSNNNTTTSSEKLPANNNVEVATNNHSIEPNCELTLEEAQLTETQIIFVYDLEA